MIWLPHIILIGFNLVNVWLDAYRILKNKKIAHGLNFGAYLTTVIACIWLFHLEVWQAVVFLLSAFFSRQITFDIPLNMCRGKNWDYVSLDKPPKALMDRIEVRIFGYNGTAPTLIYLMLWILTLIIFYHVTT
jgi:hypothetical protein